MCGIAGIIGDTDSQAHTQAIDSMLQRMKHRGPDDEGIIFFDNAALGMVRLSVIDLEMGKQPMQSHDGRYTLVFNGEIYNFKEVKEELIAKGVGHFNTFSDTEVILKAFMFWGKGCLSKFNGMFSIAIWDNYSKELFLARDRLGVKPLFYTLMPDGTFLFASEVKAFLAYPGMFFKPNYGAINHLMTFGFQLCPRTFYEGVSQVPPGHFLMVQETGFQLEKYWDYSLDKNNKWRGSWGEAKEELFDLLKDALKLRLVSDVPVSAYLSGGIDSSISVYLYKELFSGNIQTFSIGFDDPIYDESLFSKSMADYVGTEHYLFKQEPSEAMLEKMIWHLEDPLATLLNFPLLALSQEVADKGFKVVISGDGSDEIFGGYQYFRTLKAMLFCRQTNQSSWRSQILKKVNPALTSQGEAEIFLNALKSRLATNPRELAFLPYVFQMNINKELLFSEALKDSLYNSELELFFPLGEVQNLDLWDQVFYLETKMRLLNLTLPLSDKMTMANGVENRSPFLDYRVAEFAFQLPFEMKIFAMREKWILKEAFKNSLPPQIVQRKKQPLLAPPQWFFEQLGERFRFELDEGRVLEKGYFNPLYVKELQRDLNQNKEFSQAFSVLLIVAFVHIWDDLYIHRN